MRKGINGWTVAAAVLAGLALVVGYLEASTEYQVMGGASVGTLHTYRVVVTSAGDAGDAEGTGYSVRAVNGEVRALRVDYGSGISATTDIDIIGESDEYHPQVTLYEKDDSVSDTWVYPVVQRTTTTGTAVSGEYGYPLVSGRLQVDVVSSTARTGVVTVTAYVVE